MRKSQFFFFNAYSSYTRLRYESYEVNIYEQSTTQERHCLGSNKTRCGKEVMRSVWWLLVIVLYGHTLCISEIYNVKRKEKQIWSLIVNLNDINYACIDTGIFSSNLRILVSEKDLSSSFIHQLWIPILSIPHSLFCPSSNISVIYCCVTNNPNTWFLVKETVTE